VSCTPCSGNTVSTEGQCTKCELGKIANHKKTNCDTCNERESFVKGWSNISGNGCGCQPEGGARNNNGFYDARKALIVCFHDGFKQADVDDAYNTMRKENFRHKCQECPTCVDCSSGTPKLRDGYTLSGTGQLQRGEFVVKKTAGVLERQCTRHADGKGVCPNASSSTHRWAVHYAYFCDQDTAVTPTDMQHFNYFTDKPANARCNSAAHPTVLEVRSVMPLADFEKQDAGTQHKCSKGYAGQFCRSCNNSDDSLYYKPPSNHSCVPCTNADAVHLQYLAIPVIALLLSIVFALVRCCHKNPQVMPPSTVQLRKFGTGVASATEGQDDFEDHTGPQQRHGRLSLFRVALFPLIKILITYVQVTGQLAHVLHVTYPPHFSKGVGSFKWLLDVWSLFISPECLGFGSFWDKWFLRIVCQPAFFFFMVYVVYIVELSWGETVQQAAENRKQNMLRALFLSYPSMCNVAFCALDCRAVDNTESVLVDDDRIYCDTPTHQLYRLLSCGVIVAFGMGIPLWFGQRIRAASKKAWMPLTQKTEFLSCEALIERVAAELVFEVNMGSKTTGVAPKANPAMQTMAMGEAASGLSRQTSSEDARGAAAGHRERDEARLSDHLKHDVKAAFIETTALAHFSSLTEAYRPEPRCVYFESVDMLRKLVLVGLVVLAGRGSILQNVLANVLSFGFFALHVSRMPFKMREDNWLRASCEFHVFWTITTAFVMKSDLSHEELYGIKVQKLFYDWVLLVSLVICVPVMFLAALYSKLQRVPALSLESPALVPQAAFARYRVGLASSTDRSDLKKCVLPSC
jgi:hypothetical protein